MGKRPVNRARGPKPQHHPDYIRLRTLLRKWREERGFTQQQLADRLRRPQSFVAKVERGSRRIDPVEWMDFLKALNVSVEEAARSVRSNT
jgi:transcriptional regulator with XRE-family HTH domain